MLYRQRLYSTRSPEPNSISEVLVPARKIYIRIIARAFLALSLDVGAGFQVVASAFVAGELPLTQCYSKRGPARFRQRRHPPLSSAEHCPRLQT